jgi:hypothetical protein
MPLMHDLKEKKKMKWMDKKGIHFLSNFHDPEQTTFVQSSSY